MSKYRLTVIFGTAACDYADEHGTAETVKALESGELEALDGMWRTYELDTEADVQQLINALDDAWGWDASWFDTEQDQDGKWKPKYD